MAMRTSSFPMDVQLDAPYEVARWRPLVHWLMAIPHFIVYYVLSLGLNVCVFISFFAILFTGNIPSGLFDFIVMVIRYNWRVTSFAAFLREPYPPFDFTMSGQDPGNDPASLSMPYPEKLSRLLIFVKWLLAIPHFVVLLVVGIGAFFAYIGGFFAVLITGRWPAGLRDFIVGTMRWGFRLQAYIYLLTDVYPPFSLEA